MLTESRIPLQVPVKDIVEWSGVVSVGRSLDSLTRNEVAVSLIDKSGLDVLCNKGVETIVERELLLLLVRVLVKSHIAEEETVFKVLCVCTHNGLCCKGRVGISASGLTVSTPWSLHIRVDIILCSEPREFGYKGTLLQVTNLVLHGFANLLAAGCATLTDEHGVGTLELDAADYLNTETGNQVGVSICRTHDDLGTYLFCDLGHSLLTNENGCFFVCHNCVGF